MNAFFFAKKTKMAVRIDSQKIDTSSTKTDDKGFLTVPATLTRVGVFVYRLPDGTIRNEFRPPEEVFNADTLKSMLGLPVTNDHPTVSVNSQNAKDLTIGWTGDSVEKQADHVGSMVTIMDDSTIKDIQKGKQELSCGYTTDLDFKPGIYNGEKYDAVQRNIRYNHVAVVMRGRAGRGARLKLDAEDGILIETENKEIKEDNMKKITLNGKEFEVTQELFDALEVELEKVKADSEQKNGEIKTVKADLDDTEKRLDRKEGEVKGLRAEVENLQKKLDGFNSAVSDAAKERAVLLEDAKKVLSEEKRKTLDSLSNTDIKKAIVEETTDLKLDGQSEAHIDACYSSINALSKKQGSDLGKALTEGRKAKADAEEVTSDESFKKQNDDLKNAWKAKE